MYTNQHYALDRNTIIIVFLTLQFLFYYIFQNQASRNRKRRENIILKYVKTCTSNINFIKILQLCTWCRCLLLVFVLLQHTHRNHHWNKSTHIHVHVFWFMFMLRLSKTARKPNCKCPTLHEAHNCRIILFLEANQNPSGISLKHDNDYLPREHPSGNSGYLILLIFRVKPNSNIFNSPNSIFLIVLALAFAPMSVDQNREQGFSYP